MSIKDRSREILSKFMKSPRFPWERFLPLTVALILAYLLADLGTLHIRRYLLPTDAPATAPTQIAQKTRKSMADYKIITDRNIFNEDGLIPDPLTSQKSEGEIITGAPVLSSLPLRLMGTIVHANPSLSIATVEITSKNMSSSFRVGEEIDGMARVEKVERKRLIFINLNNRRPEYIEIKDDEVFNLGLQDKAPSNTTNEIVQNRGGFDFALKRADVDAMTSNLANLLQDARMEPVFGPDGTSIEGFRFMRIKPGSIYEKLGFQVGDMIRSVNGEPVNSPQKAMEMYNLLKQSNYVQLGVEREGREERFNYTVQ